MSSIFKIISFTKKFWKWYLAMGIFVVAQSSLSLAVPLLSKQIVDVIVANLAGKAHDYQPIIFFLLAIVGVDIGVTFLTAFGQWIGDRLAMRLQTHLSGQFYKHILSLDMNFFDNNITGQLTNKMYRGIESITDFIQNMLNNFLPFFLTALVTILLLSFYSPLIALMLAILFPLYILISHRSSLDWQKAENEKNSINDISQGRVFESISGIRVVKSFATELMEIKDYLFNREKIEKIGYQQTKTWHWYDFLRRLALNVILFGIYAYIVRQTFIGRYSIGEMTLLWQLANQARFPLFAMSFILGQIQAAGAGSAEFFRILEEKPKITDADGKNISEKNKPSPSMSKPENGQIEFKNVSFAYDNKRDVLRNISFSLSQGKKLALVGESGQGKTTLVNLLLRFYEPQAGRILVGGQDIIGLPQNLLRQMMAVVFQESLLFSGTISQNIKYGTPAAGDNDIIKAAKAANADQFIEELPEKYDSLVGERGIKLSGGQKQRIAIARAILKNAPIIILDEATSSLDSRAEIEVQKGLNHLLQDRTSIIIAHRLSTISSADLILVLKNGQIAEFGRPNDLLDKPAGLYRKMIELQKSLLTASQEEREAKLQEFDLVG